MTATEPAGVIELIGPTAYIEAYAAAYDALLPGCGLGAWLGELLRDLYRTALRQAVGCDCDPEGYHRWNCSGTPIWAQTIRDLDCNPWTVVSDRDASFTVLWMRTFCCQGCGDPLDEGGHGQGMCV